MAARSSSAARLGRCSIGGSAPCALAAALCAAAAGCQENGDNRVAGTQRPLEVLVSGDTAGWIVPCGCTSNQSGGLARRGGYVAQAQERADVLLLDAGGAPSGASKYDLLKFEAILRGEAVMGIAAHNLGVAETSFAPEVVAQLAQDAEVRMISTNLVRSDGLPVLPQSIIVEIGGRTIFIAGVCEGKELGPGWKARDPREALVAAFGANRGSFELSVVLAYLPDAELERLAADLPEADLIVGGPTGQSIPPRRVGSVLLASATNKGKFLARLIAPGSSQERWSGEIVEISANLPESPAQVDNLRQFYENLANEDLPADATSFGPRSDIAVGARYAGGAACADCHAAEHAAWAASSHARAWQTLVSKQSQVDSDCQRCHVTGFGGMGGFVSVRRSESLVNVGCESCHGPAEAHAADPTVRTAFFDRAADECRTCHDRENSPQFDFATYWPKVAHGESVKNATNANQREE